MQRTCNKYICQRAINALINSNRRNNNSTGSGIELIPLMRFNYWWSRVDVIQASDINKSLDIIERYNERILAFIRIDQKIDDIKSPYDFCYCELSSIVRNDNTKDENGIKHTNYTFSKVGTVDRPMLYIRPQNRKTDPSDYVNSYTEEAVTRKPIIQEPSGAPTPFYWGYTKLSIDSAASPPELKETTTLATLIVEDLDEWNKDKGNDRDGMFYVLVRNN